MRFDVTYLKLPFHHVSLLQTLESLNLSRPQRSFQGSKSELENTTCSQYDEQSQPPDSISSKAKKEGVWNGIFQGIAVKGRDGCVPDPPDGDGGSDGLFRSQ